MNNFYILIHQQSTRFRFMQSSHKIIEKQQEKSLKYIVLDQKPGAACLNSLIFKEGREEEGRSQEREWGWRGDEWDGDKRRVRGTRTIPGNILPKDSTPGFWFFFFSQLNDILKIDKWVDGWVDGWFQYQISTWSIKITNGRNDPRVSMKRMLNKRKIVLVKGQPHPVPTNGSF